MVSLVRSAHHLYGPSPKLIMLYFLCEVTIHADLNKLFLLRGKKQNYLPVWPTGFSILRRGLNYSLLGFDQSKKIIQNISNDCSTEKLDFFTKRLSDGIHKFV